MLMIQIKEKLKAVWISLGFLVCFGGMAVLREQIFKNEEGKEKFVFSVSFVALQCVANVITARIMMCYKGQPKNETPQKLYLTVGVLSILSMLAANISLEYVPFVIFLVGRSTTPIPVIILTAILARKVYTVQRYIFVTLIAFGVALFVYDEGMVLSREYSTGYALILTSLFLDGLQGASQAVMRINSKPSSLNYMFYVNCWSTLLVLPLLFINQEVIKFIQFCSARPEILIYICASTLSGSIGHYFRSAMISNFGPLPTTLLSTTRKFLSVLTSSFIYGNVLDCRQWIATVIIFEGLILDGFFGKRKIQQEEEVEKEEHNVKAEGVSAISAKVGNSSDMKVEITPEVA